MVAADSTRAPRTVALPHNLGIHYTGLTRVSEVGTNGVDTRANLLRRFEYVHRRSVFVEAGHLVQRELWELKAALGRHLYEDAEAADALRRRILDLQENSGVLDREPDQRLTLAMDELLHARSDEELLVGLYEVVKPALLAATRTYMNASQAIVDQPSVRVLRTVVADLEEQIAWGQRAVREMVDQRGMRNDVTDYAERLRGYPTPLAGSVAGRKERRRRLAGGGGQRNRSSCLFGRFGMDASPGPFTTSTARQIRRPRATMSAPAWCA